MSYAGKLKLEGAEWDGKPSKRKSETRGESINREEEKGGGESTPKKTWVTRAEEKKFKRIVAKQAKSRYYNPDPLF